MIKFTYSLIKPQKNVIFSCSCKIEVKKIDMNSSFVYKPHPLLLPLINMIMVKEVLPWEDTTRKVYSYPPTPEHCIFLYLNSPVKAKKMGESEFTRRSACVVVGPQVTRVDLELSQDHRAVMIGFQPGGLYRFLGLPMTEIFDDGYDGFDILDKDISILIDELREIRQPENINVKVQTYLLKKLQKVHELLPFDKAIYQLHKAENNYPISDLAWDACLSIRQFERKCHERLGMSPKLFSRIARFSKAYRMFEANQQLAWTQISHSCGYFDQMHLIRDFKEFTGATPGDMSRKLASNGLKFQAPLAI
jgi:AraC-like DNA-binding protein